MSESIIFDFDGVLADTSSLLLEIYREIDDRIDQETFCAHHDGNIYEEPKVHFSTDEMNLVFSKYGSRLNDRHLGWALQALENIPREIPLFIVSSNDDAAICAALERVGLLGRFKKICGKDAGTSKVEKFRLLEKEYGVPIAKSIFVTDTLGDLKEASSCDLKTIAVTFGFHSKERLRFGKPFKVVDDWKEFSHAIGQFICSSNNSSK